MHPDGIGIADYLQVRMDFFAVPEAEPDHVLLVERHQGAAARAACMAAASPIAAIV